MNYYERLNIAETASPEAIKKAYRKLAKQLHPDMNRDRDTTQEFVDLEVAYSCLSNKHSKLAYDQLLRFEREKILNPALNRKYASTVRKRTAPRRKRANYHSNLSYEQYRRDEKYNSSFFGVILKIAFLFLTAGTYYGWLASEGVVMSRQMQKGMEPDMNPMLFVFLSITSLLVIIGLSYLYEPLVKYFIVGRSTKHQKK